MSTSTEFFAKQIGNRTIVAFPPGKNAVAIEAKQHLDCGEIAECVLEVEENIATVVERLESLGHQPGGGDAKKLFDWMAEEGHFENPDDFDDEFDD